MAEGRVWAYAAPTAGPKFLSRSVDALRRPTPCGYDRADRSCLRTSRRVIDAGVAASAIGLLAGSDDMITCAAWPARRSRMSGSSSYGGRPQTAWAGREMATQARIFETSIRAR